MFYIGMCRLCIGDSQIGDAHVGTAGDVAVLQQILRHLDGVVDGDGEADALDAGAGRGKLSV